MRLTKVRTVLPEQEIDALLVSQPENRRYLSGFTGSAGLLVITPEQAMLATDSRYYEQVGREAPAFELVKVQGRVSELLREVLADLGVKRLGFESQHLTVEQLNIFSKASEGVEWLPLENTVEKIRAVKDEDEIEALRRSAALNDDALAHLLEVIKPGMTELEAAWEIEVYMRTHGASKVAFDLIVAAGPNGAMPHARPGDQAIEAGAPVVVDIGCVLDGYCSDMTRTFCLGEPGSRYLEVWNVVLQAQEAAEAVIRAGMTGVAVDAVAREVIVEAGYGDFFGHGLGHGVGLAVHEKPGASRLSEDTFEAGMSLTVEPGIYLPGEFGVRIEDLAIIGADGIEILSNTPKRPVVD
jgi:Xaa-Pro aminopeptidase